MKKSDKRGLAIRELILWAIGLGILVIVILFLLALKTKNFNIIETIKHFINFGKNG